LRLFQNLFLPSVKLLAKQRVGARVRRRYDAPRTPLERVLACPEITPQVAAELQRQRDRLDPFALAAAIGHQARAHLRPRQPPPSPTGLRRASRPCRGPPARAPAAQQQARRPGRRVTPQFLGNISGGAMIHPSVTFSNGLTGTLDQVKSWTESGCRRRCPCR